jgi:hypothetical protein
MTTKKDRARQHQKAKRIIKDNKETLDFFRDLSTILPTLESENSDYSRLPLPDIEEFKTINSLKKTIPLSKWTRK